jgi:SAM-dependent methyltransferase
VSSARVNDAKAAAIEQWTADPCEEHAGTGTPGTRAYFESLLAVRRRDLGWLDDTLAYAGTSGMDVLDVGCGQGIDVYRYAEAGARVTGIDLTPRHVELATAHLAAMGAGATLLVGDAETLPFDDESFDRVSTNGVLHHTPDFDTAVREIRRVLRPGGEARIVVYNRNSLHYWLQQVAFNGVARGQLLKEGSMAGVLSANVEYSSIDARPLVRVYSARALRGRLRAAGLVDVRTTVRQFAPSDTYPTQLARNLAPLRNPAVLDRIGRLAGWYVIATGRRAAQA